MHADDRDRVGVALDARGQHERAGGKTIGGIGDGRAFRRATGIARRAGRRQRSRHRDRQPLRADRPAHVEGVVDEAAGRLELRIGPRRRSSPARKARKLRAVPGAIAPSAGVRFRAMQRTSGTRGAHELKSHRRDGGGRCGGRAGRQRRCEAGRRCSNVPYPCRAVSIGERGGRGCQLLTSVGEPALAYFDRAG